MTKVNKKDEVLNQIIDVIKSPFEEKGFQLKRKYYFESEDSYGNIQQYEIHLTNRKGYFSMQLRLNLLNKLLLKKVNSVLEKALKDEDYPYFQDESSINIRLKSAYLTGITDWKIFKNSDESLEDFNKRFSIWICNFDDISEKKNWKEQLLESVNLATQWFLNIGKNDEWIISNTDYPALYLLKEKGKEIELQKKYEDIMVNFRLKEELKLCFKHLNQ